MRRCQVVTDWLSDTQDLPADVVRAAQVGKAAVNDIPIESWLLIDSRSQRLFGKPFDQVDQASLANFAYVPSNCRAQTQYSKLLFKSNFIQHLQQPQTHAKTVSGLSKIRYMSQQASTIPTVLKSLNPNEGDVYKYEAAHREWESIKPYLSSQENEHLANEFRQAKSRIVQPILRQRADKLVKNAKGISGLNDIDQLRRDLGGIDREASERLDQSYNRILADVVTEEKKRLNKIGKGPESLLEEAKWFKSFDQPGALGYIAPRHPEVIQLHQEFNQRRDKSLKDNQNELSKLIASAKTENDLNTIVTQYLPLRQDQESKVGAALMAEGAQRAIVINRNKVLGYATEGKHNYSGKDEPTEVDMYDAVNDRFLNLNAGVEELARSCTQGRFQNDPFMTMQCLGLMMTGGTDGKSVFSFTTQITQFKKLGSCEKARGEPGFVCVYTLGMSSSMPAMTPSMAALLGNATPTQARFVWTGDYWLLMQD